MRRRFAFGIFLVAFLVYVFPLVYDLAYKPFFAPLPAQDVASTALMPIGILTRGDFSLNEYWDFFRANWRDPYFVAQVDGRIVSRSPAAAAVLALPFYGVMLGTGWITNPTQPWLYHPWTAFFVAKLAAAFMASLAVAMFFAGARALTDHRTSIAVTIAFAFGTSVWSTASQSLWQQTPSVLLQAIAVWLILRGRKLGAHAVAPAAFFLSLATIARANNVVAALLWTIYVVYEHRSALLRWVLWSIPPIVFFLGYNAMYNGSPFVFGYQDGILNYITVPQLEGILGLFVSPSRGLVVYSPFFIFAFYGFWLARQLRMQLFYAVAAIIIAVNVLLISMWGYWDGGWGYGTRMLTDVLPYFALLLIPAVEQLKGIPRFAFWALVIYAAVLQSFGLWDYGVRWHWSWENWTHDNWDVARSEPLFYLQQYVSMVQRFLQR